MSRVLVPVLSVVFALLALLALGQIVSALRARRLLPELAAPEDRPRISHAVLAMSRTNAVVGVFFAGGAAVVWSSLPFGIVLGGLPLVAFALLAATGNVAVISKRSSE